MVRQSGEARLPAATSRPHHICHWAAIGSIKFGSLFLTLPTRGLTGQHVMFSAE